MPKPRLSVIIPTYNERDNINPLIDRLTERAEDVEVIVVDSALTSDKTLDSIANTTVLKISSSKASRAEQMHAAAEMAQSELLYFVHADTRPPVDYLHLIEKSIADGNEFGLFSYRFDSDSRLLKIDSSSTRHKGMFTGGGDQGLFIQKATYL